MCDPTLPSVHFFSCRELVEAGAAVPSLLEVLLTHSLETKGTDWDMLHALLRSAVEDKAVQVRLTWDECLLLVC